MAYVLLQSTVTNVTNVANKSGVASRNLPITGAIFRAMQFGTSFIANETIGLHCTMFPTKYKVTPMVEPRDIEATTGYAKAITMRR